MNNQYHTLSDENGKIVAAGSYDAIRAAARLLFGPNARVYNTFENEVMSAAYKNAVNDIINQMDEEFIHEYNRFVNMKPFW